MKAVLGKEGSGSPKNYGILKFVVFIADLLQITAE
jgi:hypothetical protein